MVDILKNTPLVAAVASFLTAQSIKVIIRRDWSAFKSYGGMPSGHSSAISGLAFSLGRCAGFDSPATAVAVGLLMVVIADAVNLRPYVREDLGHTWLQAFVGAALGFIIAYILPGRTPLW
ncbi:MAG: acid phosphatase [Thermotogae bacterium]|nr:MAG: acid phosphatase [Thermotogota bacterium]